MSYADNFRKIRQSSAAAEKSNEGSVTLPSLATAANPSTTFVQNFRAIRNEKEKTNTSTVSEPITSYAPPDFTDYDNKVTAAETAMQGFASKLTAAETAYKVAGERVTAAQSAVENAQKKAEALAEYAKLGKSETANQLYQQAYADYKMLYGQYTSQFNSASALEKRYNDLLSEYQTAYGAYQTAFDERKTAYDTWRNTLRVDDAVLSDIAGINNEIDQLKAQREKIAAQVASYSTALPYMQNVPAQYAIANAEKAKENQAQLDSIDAKLADLNAQKNLLNDELYWSNAVAYQELDFADDFAEKSKVGAAKVKPGEEDSYFAFANKADENDVLYDFINNIGDYRETKRPDGILERLMTDEEYGDYSKYTHLKPEEIDRYNYLYNTKGAEQAKKYLDFLDDDLNRRLGGEIASDKNWLEKILYAGQVGIDQFTTGVKQLFSDEALPMSHVQYAGQEIRESMGTFGKFVYDFAQTAANMAPSILLSTGVAALTGGVGVAPLVAGKLGAAVGSVGMSASAAGNAYREKVAAGYDPDAAKNYAMLVGASEGLLQYFLGGVGKLGGMGSKVANAVSGIDNAYGRFALQMTGKMISEGTEEGLQEILEPLFAMATLNEDYSAAKFEDVAYSFLLGAASAGLFEFTDTINENVDTTKKGNVAKALGDDFVQSLIDTAKAKGKGTVDYKVAQKLQEKLDNGKKVSAYQIGRIYAENAEGALSDWAKKRETVEQTNAEGAPLEAVLPTVAKTEQDQQGTSGDTENAVETPVAQNGALTLPTAEQTERQQRAANAATELERTGILYGATDDAIATAKRVGDAVGRNIVFYNQPAKNGKIENGYYNRQTNTIHVNTASKKAVQWTIAHELTHSIEKAGGYEWLSDLVVRRYQQTGGNINAERARIAEQYRSAVGQELDASGLTQEVVANYVADHLLTNEQAIISLVSENRTWGQKILDWIDSLLAKLGNKTSQERAFLIRARKYYTKALAQTSFTEQTAKSATTQSETSKTFDHEAELSKLNEQYRTGAITEEEYDDQYDLMEQDAAGKGIGLNRYSIGRTTENKPFVEIEEDILAGVPESEWVSTVKKNLQKKFPNGVTVGNSDIAINSRTGGEITFSEYSKWLRRNDSNVLADKFRATNNADEILVAAKNWVNEKPRHPRSDDIRDFGRGYVLLRIGSKDYSAEVVVGILKNGTLRLHDLVQIEPTSFIKKETDTAIGVNPSPEVARNTVSISDGIVSQPDDSVKQYSITENSNGEELSAEQQEYFKDSKVVDEFGRLKVMYHGTPNGTFTVFRDGTYFTDNQAYADLYQNPGASSISVKRTETNRKTYAVYLNITKPFVLSDPEARDIYINEYIKGGNAVGISPYMSVAEYRAIKSIDWMEGEDLREFLQDNGYDYDGLVLDEGATGGYGEEVRSRGNSYVIFSPEQVKDVDNTTPTNDPDYRFSISEQENSETTESIPEATLPMVETETDNGLIIPAKAQPHLRRAERSLYNGMAKAFGVPKFTDRKFLLGMIKEISDEYLRTGKVSPETLNTLFERGYETGLVIDREFYDTYKHVKDYLRTQPLTISDYDANNIPDYTLWKKQAWGKLRIVNKGGLPVDSAYQELMGMAPELFPDDIVNPAEQLMHMYDVSDSIRISEQTLEKVYADDAEEYRAWAKNDFDTSVAEVLNDLRNVKRYVDDRNAPEKVESVESIDEVKAAYANLKQARRNRDKVMAKLLLTDHDKVQVGRLLRGEIEVEHLDPKKDNVNAIKLAYEASKEYDRYASLIKRWKQRLKSEMYARVDEDISTANQWHDKSAGILYSRETMERNIRDIVDDKSLADKIVKIYFAPIHKAAAAATKTKESYRDRIRALNISRKVKKGNEVSEAYAVQLFGEAEDNIRMIEDSKGRMNVRDGKTLQEWQDLIFDLWRNNPNLDPERIKNAVEEFRKIYDELFERMNEVRVRNGYEPINYRRGYFPHFQQDNEGGILGLFGKALGISTEVTALPTTINGLTHTFRPGIRWIAAAQERTGFATAYDAVEGFDKYIEGVADVIHQTDNIQRLRALSDRIRYRTSDEGLRKQVDAVLENPTLSEQEKTSLLKEIYENGKYTLSNFVVELEEYTNLLANKKSFSDRQTERWLKRKWYNIAKALESRIAANMVAVNPASWLTNFIALTQGNATLKRGELLRGMWQTLKATKDDDGIVAQSAFLTNRLGSEPLVRTWSQKTSAKLAAPMEWIDQFTAGSLVRARYDQNLRAGMSEQTAMDEADAWVAGVMADRSKGSVPTLFEHKNPLAKIFTQFQLEVNNQLSYMFKDMPREAGSVGRLALMLFKFAFGAWLFNELYEYFIGRRPALDPIGMLNDTVGDLFGYELPNLVELGVGAVTGDLPSFEVESTDGYTAVANLGQSVAENLPFIGGLFGGGRVPISSALPDIKNLLKATLSDNWDSKKRWTTIGKELLTPATYLALPFGGGQLKKIYQGIRGVIEGGSYTVDNEGNDVLQYPIYTDSAWETAKNAAGAMLFGTTSLPTGSDWVESGFNSLSAKETAVYQGMTEVGVSQRDAFALIREISAITSESYGKGWTAERRNVLRNSDVSDVGKSILYYGMLANDDKREFIDTLLDYDVDEGMIGNIMLDLDDAERMDDKRRILINAQLTDKEIELFAGYVMGTDMLTDAGNPTAYAELLGVMEAGIDGDKALQMLIDDQDLGKVLEFIDSGMSPDSAVDLSDALADLEPIGDKTRVSAVQKWRAAIDSVSNKTQQLYALQSVMTDATYEKVSIGIAHNVTAETYVSVYELLPKHDADGNESYSSEEIRNAIDAFSGDRSSSNVGGIMLPSYGTGKLTAEQKAVLWQLLTGSKSAANNPYSETVGWEVLADRGIYPKEKESGIIIP